MKHQGIRLACDRSRIIVLNYGISRTDQLRYAVPPR